MSPNSHLYFSAAVIVVAALVIFGKWIYEKATSPFRRFSRWMKDLTGDYSGEDSDQCVAVADPLEQELQRRIARAGQKPQPGLYHSRRNGAWVGCAIVGSDRFGRPMVRFEKGEAPISVRSRAKLRAG